MDDEAIYSLFMPLLDDVSPAENFPEKKPLLAHYTSINVLEAVLKHEEIWLSNPLFMNDTQEMRFAINEGIELFRLSSDSIKAACKSEELYRTLVHSFEFYADEFVSKGVLDTYVFCMSEHETENTDGRLSMWRGYGSNGNGAAIVIDTAKIEPINGSPLVLSQISYMSPDEQKKQLEHYIEQFVNIVSKSEIPVERCHIAAFALFERLKVFAIFTKHHAFHEEQEWRLAYLNSRDLNNTLQPMIDYWIGPRGVEPKLKLKLAPIPDVFGEGAVLSNIVDRIILGPSLSSPLSKAMVLKMLAGLKASHFGERVHASSIPFRML